MNASIKSVALVTGATRGIGAAVARTLKMQGHHVIGTATTQEGAAKIAATGIESCVLEVGKAEDGHNLITDIVNRYGGLHVLVNNAGITRDGLIMRMKDEDFDAVIDINLRAVFRLCRAVSRPMMKQRMGRIVNITSVVGAMGNAGQANYAASKAAVSGMTKALARELASRNITVNCVAPGFIATDMTESLSEEQKTLLKEQIPLGRLGTPDDVAAAVGFLAGDSGAYITGQELHVNGGMLMI